MQNYNNPMQPQGGYGVQPPPKKGMSTGVKILIVVVVLVVIGGFILVAAGIGGAYWLTRKAQEAASVPGSTTPTGLSGTSNSSSTAGSDAEPPAPTADQLAAIAGG